MGTGAVVRPKHWDRQQVKVQQLAGLPRLKLTTKIGRKTFVTLKRYQGVLAHLIMQATGHQLDEAFKH